MKLLVTGFTPTSVFNIKLMIIVLGSAPDITSRYIIQRYAEYIDQPIMIVSDAKGLIDVTDIITYKEIFDMYLDNKFTVDNLKIDIDYMDFLIKGPYQKPTNSGKICHIDNIYVLTQKRYPTGFT
jgi:hypothetical protein